MKKYLLTLALSASALICGAQNIPDLNISDLSIARDGSRIEVAMKVHPSLFKLKTNSQWLVTPVIYSAETTDSVALSPFMVTGKNAFYYAQRNAVDEQMPLLRAGKGEDIDYSDAATFEPWMNTSVLKLRAEKVSCCGQKPSDVVENTDVAELNFLSPVFESDFEYVFDVTAEIKERKLSGSAFVNFKVNATAINPDYMSNRAELRKILNTIDSVKLNPDAVVDTIMLTGYASPEGSYAANARLAQGRTEALQAYVMKLYNFPKSVYFAKSVPEDWAGLRKYVESSTLADRSQILDLIDDASIPVEKKNDRLKAKFPKSYAFLLKNVYPSLRHTDYYIHYVIRQFTSVEEIKEVLARDPRNLSLNEFYIVAKSLEPGSEEFFRLIEQARAYNEKNPMANLNAANAAMTAGELERAERYLQNAGNSPEAEYARGVLNALRKDYDKAAPHLNAAKNAGVGKAKNALDNIARIKKASQQIKFINN